MRHFVTLVQDLYIIQVNGFSAFMDRAIEHLFNHSLFNSHPLTYSLSIRTFRSIPPDLRLNSDRVQEYLNQLNTELLTQLQNSGEAYLSNAVIDGKFALRACIVNFRTSFEDIEALPEIVVRIGREVDSALRTEALKIKI